MSQKWLLIRGFTREKRHWGSFPEEFGKALDADVVCLDAPGFGTESQRRSPRTAAGIADDIRSRWLEVRGDDDEWSILGISLGGIVTQAWCDRYPDDFARCVLVNTAAGRLALPHLRTRPSVPFAIVKGRFGGSVVAERATIATSSNRTDLDREALARQYAEWLDEYPPSSRSIAGQALAVASFRPPASLPVPVLVLGSRGDRMVSYRCAEQLAKRYGGALRLHETAGHDLMLDDADWVCEQIRSWIDSTKIADRHTGPHN